MTAQVPRPARTVRRTARLDRSRLAHVVAVLILPWLGVAEMARQIATGHSTWLGLWLLLAFWFLSGIGVTLGYHRLVTHRAFTTRKGIKAALIFLGGFAAQGPVIYWAALHRRHHALSDRPGDPHSPHFDGETTHSGWRGFLHAHLGWMFSHEIPNTLFYAPDLLKDPLVSRLNRLYPVSVAMGLVLPALIGAAVTHTAFGAWQGLVWGGLARMALGSQIIWSVNSISHLIGARDFDTADHSRNNHWLSILSLGESLHNTHHNAPRSACFAARPWHLDPGWLLLRLGERLGFVKTHPQTQRIIDQRRSRVD